MGVIYSRALVPLIIRAAAFNTIVIFKKKELFGVYTIQKNIIVV